MLLTVIRDEIKKDYTGGSLAVDGVPFCRTIEPPRGYASGPVTSNQSPVTSNHSPVTSNHSKGCIPMGWYKIRVTYSPKFKRNLPLLHLVPGFSGIRIHAGLSVNNTNGCICVGERWREDKLTSILIKAQERNEEIWICITDKDRASSELSVGYKPDET